MDATPQGRPAAGGDQPDPPATAASGSDEPPPTSGAAVERAGRGLVIWLVLLLAFGVGGLALGMEELAGMAAASGLFVLAQAADADARFRYLHYSVTWVVPAGGLMLVMMMTYQLFFADAANEPSRGLLIPALLVAAVASLLSAFRPVADLVAWTLFRIEPVTHTLRLTARLVVVILVLALPGWFVLRAVFHQLFDPTTPLIDRSSLEGQLVGYILLALAGVGFLIRRDVRATAERLGLGPIGAGHLVVLALGVVSLYGLNAGADWVQRAFFPELWQSDHQVNQMIAAGLDPARIALLGVSAGVGEEITLRGGLQPRLGLVMTSLLFAALHLQYSWFGIAVIFLLAMILGVIRIRTNTSVAMAVHAIYDIVALASMDAGS